MNDKNNDGYFQDILNYLKNLSKELSLNPDKFLLDLIRYCQKKVPNKPRIITDELMKSFLKTNLNDTNKKVFSLILNSNYEIDNPIYQAFLKQIVNEIPLLAIIKICEIEFLYMYKKEENNIILKNKE